ncbi:MAG: hypothetical protein KJO55_03250, partial [Gammaproteobacteria bacterium]|nr:hypothetical protein [Gammaproteobacteria bacterium]
MDIDHDQETTSADAAREIVLASEVLPAAINLLPLGGRPFFPGQAIPMIVAEEWEQTIQTVLT